MLSDQELIDYFGENVGVEYEVTTNVSVICKSKITLHNKGSKVIPNGDWAIYLYHLCQIASESLEIDVDHVVGGLFKLTPTAEFRKLQPGGKFELKLSSDEALISRFTIFPNWYVTQDGFVPRLLKATADESLSFVKDFSTSKQWKKGKMDKLNPFTPEERYDKYHIEDFGKPIIPVIPTPLECDLREGEMINLSEGKWLVVNEEEIFQNEAEILANRLGLQLCKDKVTPEQSNAVTLKLEEVKDVSGSNEAYMIVLDKKKPAVVLMSPSSAGMFYAIQTLFSLLENPPNGNRDMLLPSGLIVDSPRFPYRGIHVDVARNFVDAKEIMKLIKVISTYKMNKLHLHLTDDEGWRIEIKDLPELTEIGAKRDHNLAEEGLAVEPTLGSGPSYKTPSCGFYSVEEYRNILRCAKDHHVEVIPEIDMPGHSYAAVVSMTSRYKKFKEAGDMDAALEYMLIDMEDDSSYTSDQKYTNNTMNPCTDGSKNFVSKIISTVKDLHEPIQPLKVFHVGGDEVPLGAWDASSLCQTCYKENNLDGTDPFFNDEVIEDDDDIESRKMTSALQEYFLQYVEKVCCEEELQLAVWNDGIHDPTVKVNSQPRKLVHAWRISRKNERHNPNILANSGYQVVISSATHTYFDHPYEPDPEENGLHWCVRMLDTKTVFGIRPYDMYACQDKRFKNVEHAKLEKKSGIIGIQSQIWGELIRCDEMLEHMQFPRLLAIAERSWHEASWENVEKSSETQEKDWVNFANTVGYKELKRLEKLRVHYRIPPPGLKVENENLAVTSVYPGLRYKFKKSGEEIWKDLNVPCEIGTFNKGEKYEFATSSFDGSRMSRIVSEEF